MSCQYTSGDNFVIIHFFTLIQFLHCTYKESDYLILHKDIYTNKARHKRPGGRQDGAERKWTREAKREVEIDTVKRTERQIKTGT